MKTEEDRIPMQPGVYDFRFADENEIRARMKKDWKQDDMALEERDVRDTIRVEIRRILSDQGATCMTYEGILGANGRKVIVKEFYPYSSRNIWGISRDGGDQRLRIPGERTSGGRGRSRTGSASLREAMSGRDGCTRIRNSWRSWSSRSIWPPTAIHII